ncbi:MAG: hypothetical protein NC548_56665, partial [Lachnospiraceae bacterium]|nr:hypothetical protein [Lachnospiraceae bacterium]
MLYTTYFAYLRHIKDGDNVIPISIAAKPPVWWTGLKYEKLAPSYECLMKYKKDGNTKDYVQRYCKETLGELNPIDVACDFLRLIPSDKQKLVDMVNCPLWENPYVHIALVCYEKPEDFCHRHIDRAWFNESNIRCNELLPNNRKSYEVDLSD